MLRFEVYNDGQPARQIDLGGGYVFGQDTIPVRADLAVQDGSITCLKRVPGACGLAMKWSSGTAGEFLLNTPRLPERKEPYNLNLELARHRLGRLVQKREDWGLFDYRDAAPLNEDLHTVRSQFVDALNTSDPGRAARIADRALANAIILGEKMALFHGEILLRRRSGTRNNPPLFGCRTDLLSSGEDYLAALKETFDFLSVPMPWKHIEPKEHTFRYAQIDRWVNWAARNRKVLYGGPLLSFEPEGLPQWLYIWEHDYEALRDLIYEHIQRSVSRYKNQVRVWKVVSGIHAFNSFDMSFEQLMELTRMSCLLVKKLAPRSRVMIELVQPWGEYYSRNQRSIPPLLYADMAVQSGIKFDAFGVRLFMGVPVDGYYVRDLMQISSLLDEFVGFGKAVHVTGVQVPSETTADAWDAWSGKKPIPKAGRWHQPWSQRLQAEWLQAFYRVAMSKPYVESVCWEDLADYEGHHVPHGGLLQNNMQPKLAYRELRNFKARLRGGNGDRG
ncbi:MAG: endo-1,4-beta-xylanase [Phycisphaerae bacterium]